MRVLDGESESFSSESFSFSFLLLLLSLSRIIFLQLYSIVFNCILLLSL